MKIEFTEKDLAYLKSIQVMLKEATYKEVESDAMDSLVFAKIWLREFIKKLELNLKQPPFIEPPKEPEKFEEPKPKKKKTTKKKKAKKKKKGK